MVVKSDAYLPINTDDLSKSKVSKVSDLLNIQNGTTAIKANDDLEARIQQQQFGSNVKDKVVFASENGSCNGNEPLNRSCPNAKVMTNVEGSQRESETLTLANIQATNETKSKNIDDYESQQQLRLENNLHKNPIINNTDEDANGQCDIDNNLQEDEECEEDSAPQVPQVKEGGWGWFVVLGTFICYWLVPGMIRSYGAVYLEILETFPEATAAEAGWVPALLSSISIGLAPISAILGKFYTCRNVVFVGGLFCSIGLTLSSFATSVFYLYITFGLIAGIGAGLITTPCVIVINSYFVKKRALASGMCLSGAAVGSFTIPIFVEYIVRQYRFRGTMLIMGAILLHVCASSLLYTPDGKWRSKNTKKCKRMRSGSKAIIANGTIPPITLAGDKKQVSLNKVETIDGTNQTTALLGDKMRKDSLLVDRLRSQSLMGERCLTGPGIGKDMLLVPPSLRNSQHLSLRSRSRASSLTPSLQHVKMLSSSLSHSVNDVTTSSVFYQNDDDSSSDRGSDEADGKLTSSGKTRRSKLFKQIKKFLSNCLDFNLFKEWTFLVTVVAGSCVAGAFPHVYFFVPAFSQTMGFTKVDAAMLLSIASGVDLVSRISYGYFMDLGIIRRSYGLFISLAASTIGSFCIPLANSFGLLAFFTAVYGFGSGTSLMLLPVILADNHGVDKLPSSYGLMRLFQGCVTLVVPPLAGTLKDKTGIYNYCFVLMGCIVSIGAVAILLMPCAQRRDLKRQQQIIKSPPI